jgi:hypothetical protein
MIEKIISGVQTGADQVALNAAIGLNISHGGWIKQQLGIWSVNEKLKQSYIQIAREEGLDESNPPKGTIKRIWKNLRAAHKLRVMK